jgi:hypothetical protein
VKYVVIDFETASQCDLQKRGAWVYASDFSTFLLTVAFKVVENGIPQKTRVLDERQMMALDTELLSLARDPDVIFVAHNASFEQPIWRFHMVPMGYPELPPERWHDTMAVAAMKALPMGLDALTQALELPIGKDMDGHRLMLRMCKPNLKGEWEHGPDNMQRLKDYCVGDVDAQYASHVVLKGLGPSERDTWILDQRINQRGIKIDKTFVHACIDVLDQVRVPMTQRFMELTGVKPTQREKILNWVNDQGVPLSDVKKATLDAILDPDDEFGIEHFDEPLPYHVHEALTLRRSLASSSVAKLERMLMCMGQDGRVRYTTQYHGARAGRDAGRLIQVQNYPRGEIGDRQGLTADILADAILTRHIGTIKELWGDDIFSAVISSLRSCIVPEEGKVICAGDFAAVEARNLLSMAGQHDRVDQMHSGIDVYNEQASMIYKRPIDRKKGDLKEGQVGKACLAADTLVATHNGWKPIVKVLDTDLLWDGKDWVTHEGLLFKGYKETLNLSGLRLTRNHEVFDGDQWFRAGEATIEQTCRALAFAKAHGPFWVTPTQSKDVLPVQFASVIAETARFLSSSIISAAVVLRGATFAPRKKRLQPYKTNIGVMGIFVPTYATEPDCLIAYPPLSRDAQIRKIETIDITQGEVLKFTPTGCLMEINIQKRLLHLVDVFLNILCPLKDGMIRAAKSTVSIMTAITNLVIFGLQREVKMHQTRDRLLNCKINWTLRLKKSPCFEPVYDLTNAGPNHRFTVMTSKGPIIVHNCVLGAGYGLGPVGFRARFTPKDSIDLAMLTIKSYRTDFAPMVPKFWYGLWEASVSAVWCNEGKSYEFAGVVFRVKGEFLTMRLPSGRHIYYHRPKKARTYDPQGNERASWTFMSYQGKKFRRHWAWHGMITADCIQGSSRCLMVGAAKRAEKAGLTTIFKVHDELVFEEYDRPDLALTVQQIMEDIEPWAHERRFRVKAEVETMLRYRK